MIYDIHGDVFQWLFKPKTVCPSLSLVDELVDTPLVPEEDSLNTCIESALSHVEQLLWWREHLVLVALYLLLNDKSVGL